MTNMSDSESKHLSKGFVNRERRGQKFLHIEKALQSRWCWWWWRFIWCKLLRELNKYKRQQNKNRRWNKEDKSFSTLQEWHQKVCSLKARSWRDVIARCLKGNLPQLVLVKGRFPSWSNTHGASTSLVEYFRIQRRILKPLKVQLLMQKSKRKPQM